MIFATGGTIAGRGSSSTASGVYTAGAIGVEALVEGKHKSCKAFDRIPNLS
jgi:L-asparaginase/Glu-tRNA(Gln) amidotransferase subunit D